MIAMTPAIRAATPGGVIWGIPTSLLESLQRTLHGDSNELMGSRRRDCTRHECRVVGPAATPNWTIGPAGDLVDGRGAAGRRARTHRHLGCTGAVAPALPKRPSGAQGARREESLLCGFALGCPGFGGVGSLDSCCRDRLMPSFELDGCEHAKG